MGKVKSRVLGDPELEKKQKEEQKKKSAEKKMAKKSGKGELTKQVAADDEAMAKMQKAKDLLEKEPVVTKAKAGKEGKKKIKVRIRGKQYLLSKKLVDKKKLYSLKDAIELLKKLKYSKFDESVELHINVDKEGIKGEVELPHSTGKTTRVRIVDEKLLGELEKGKIEFDILITHPQYMPKLVKYAKVLGPKGLMPNPKAGTISPKPEEVAKKFSKGALRWKTEPKAPIVHAMIGKVSLKDNQIQENASTFMTAVGQPHIVSVFIKTTMSPSVRIQI